ncbi:hypothetical protein ACEPAG_2949 [Sanghuangporus baumii]
MEEVIEFVRAFRPSRRDVLRLYPQREQAPLEHDPRIIEIVVRYLRNFTFDDIFRVKDNACPFRGCLRKHAIVVGLGEKCNRTPFGRLMFQCEPSLSSPKYLDLPCQLTRTNFAAAVYEVFSMRPLPILTSTANEQNLGQWVALLPIEYKSPTEAGKVEITAALACARAVQPSTVRPADVVSPSGSTIPTKPAKRQQKTTRPASDKRPSPFTEAISRLGKRKAEKNILVSKAKRCRISSEL